MAAIDRDLLLADVKMFLGYISEEEPGPNVLSDASILVVAESVILKVGDDDEFYPIVLCKTLKACATQNKVLATIDPNRGLRREESNKREIEWFDTDPVEYWKDYIAGLPELCETFGVDVVASKHTGVFYANVSRPVLAPATERYFEMPYPEDLE